MSLEPKATVTPLTPSDIFRFGIETGLACLDSYGGFTRHWGDSCLDSQYTDNQLWCRCNKEHDNTLDEWWMDGAFDLYVHTPTRIWGENRQILVVFTVCAPVKQVIQVYVGSGLVREEVIEGLNVIAVIYDITSFASLKVRPKHESSELGFRSADIYIL